VTDILISDITEYTEAAEKTRAKDLPPMEELAVLTLGLMGEAGEFAEHIKKHIGHGHDINPVLLQKELGDILWYWSQLHQYFGFDPRLTMGLNIEKLRRRYPGGFSSERSISRDE
jgi:NTP pyrophosphatase (non-canonical NTP hydrolase)